MLLILLGTGQLLAHLLLGAVAHGHSPATAPPAAAMLTAHLVAVAAGAAMIAACDRLCGSLSRAVRATVRPVCPPVAAAPAVATVGADQPMRSVLFLATSMSYRGPPVSCAC